MKNNKSQKDNGTQTNPGIQNMRNFINDSQIVHGLSLTFSNGVFSGNSIGFSGSISIINANSSNNNTYSINNTGLKDLIENINLNNSSNVFDSRARYSRNNNIVSKIDDFTIVVEDEEIMKGEKSISNDRSNLNEKIKIENMKGVYENSTFLQEDKKEKDKSNTTNNDGINDTTKEKNIKDKHENTEVIEIDEDEASIKIKVEDDMYEENDDDSKENDDDDEEILEKKLKEKIERTKKKLASLENRLKKCNNRQLLGRKKK